LPPFPVLLQVLFGLGLPQTRQAIKDKATAIVVEGYFDVVAMHGAGVRFGGLGGALVSAVVGVISIMSLSSSSSFFSSSFSSSPSSLSSVGTAQGFHTNADGDVG
jgi:hypothetical protein